MTKFNEPTAQQIADEKLYTQMGLREDEYDKVVELLGRHPLGVFLITCLLYTSDAADDTR